MGWWSEVTEALAVASGLGFNLRQEAKNESIDRFLSKIELLTRSLPQAVL